MTWPPGQAHPSPSNQRSQRGKPAFMKQVFPRFSRPTLSVRICQDLSWHYQGWHQGWIRLILAPAGNVPDESAGLTSQSSSKYGNEQTPQNIPTKQPSAQPNDLSNCQPTCEGTQNSCHSGQKGNQPKETAMGNKKNQPNTHTQPVQISIKTIVSTNIKSPQSTS